MAGLFGLAFSSFNSATSESVSSSSSMPLPVAALVSTNGVSPPMLSGIRPRPYSCCSVLLRLALGRSTLLMATTMDTPAALAWLMASSVCGMTPSSAATTMTAMSVTWAPRARILVNASWPGVSRKVIGLPSCSTRQARITCVMPPASVADDVALANAVQQRRFAVIDVAHDGHDRRARHQILGVVRFLVFGEEHLLGVGLLLDIQFAAQVEGDRLGHDRLQDGVDGDEQSLSHQLANHFIGAHTDGFREGAHRDRQ